MKSVGLFALVLCLVTVIVGAGPVSRRHHDYPQWGNQWSEFQHGPKMTDDLWDDYHEIEEDFGDYKITLYAMKK